MEQWIKEEAASLKIKLHRAYYDVPTRSSGRTVGWRLCQEKVEDGLKFKQFEVSVVRSVRNWNSKTIIGETTSNFNISERIEIIYSRLFIVLNLLGFWVLAWRFPFGGILWQSPEHHQHGGLWRFVCYFLVLAFFWQRVGGFFLPDISSCTKNRNTREDTNSDGYPYGIPIRLSFSLYLDKRKVIL